MGGIYSGCSNCYDETENAKNRRAALYLSDIDEESLKKNVTKLFNPPFNFVMNKVNEIVGGKLRILNNLIMNGNNDIQLITNKKNDLVDIYNNFLTNNDIINQNDLETVINNFKSIHSANYTINHPSHQNRVVTLIRLYDAIQLQIRNKTDEINEKINQYKNVKNPFKIIGQNLWWWTKYQTLIDLLQKYISYDLDMWVSNIATYRSDTEQFIEVITLYINRIDTCINTYNGENIFTEDDKYAINALFNECREFMKEELYKSSNNI